MKPGANTSISLCANLLGLNSNNKNRYIKPFHYNDNGTKVYRIEYIVGQ